MYKVGDFYQSSTCQGVVLAVTNEHLEIETVNSEGDVENIFIEIKE